MAKAQIMLIICFLIFFYLTRIVWVRIIKENHLVIELHLPLLALCLSFKNKRGNKNKKASTKKYINILSKFLSHIKYCYFEIDRITLPMNRDKFNAFSLIKPYGYQGLLYAIIAYVKTKSSGLIIKDNAIISSPDVSEIQFFITIKLRLFQLIYALLTVKSGINKKAKRIKNVGE